MLKLIGIAHAFFFIIKKNFNLFIILRMLFFFTCFVLFDCHCQPLIHGRAQCTHTQLLSKHLSFFSAHARTHARSLNSTETYYAQLFILFWFSFCGCAIFIYQILRFNGHPPTLVMIIFQSLLYTHTTISTVSISWISFCISQKHMFHVPVL